MVRVLVTVAVVGEVEEELVEAVTVTVVDRSEVAAARVEVVAGAVVAA